MLKNFSTKIWYFFLWGLRPPAPPTGAALPDPACFWIEDPSLRFLLNGIQELTATSVFLLMNTRVTITQKIEIGLWITLKFVCIQNISQYRTVSWIQHLPRQYRIIVWLLIMRSRSNYIVYYLIVIKTEGIKTEGRGVVCISLFETGPVWLPKYLLI